MKLIILVALVAPLAAFAHAKQPCAQMSELEKLLLIAKDIETNVQVENQKVVHMNQKIELKMP